jgi:hypothetical protein
VISPSQKLLLLNEDRDHEECRASTGRDCHLGPLRDTQWRINVAISRVILKP